MSTTEVMDLFPDKCGERSETESKKLCADCKTTKTPLWRSGPHGPKSLCNACGIKFRKKKGRVTVMVLKKESSDKKKDKSSPSSSSSTTACAGHKKGNNGKTSSVSSRGNDGNLGRKLKVRLMGFGQEMVLLRRPRSPMKRQWSGRKKLGEVEEAAVLLMAMSCASIYA